MLRLATAFLASTAVLLAAGVPGAGAAPCENCPQDEGGGVPAPAPPPPAPTVIAGTLQFRHPLDTKALNALKPIRSAEVRVVREGPIEQTAARVHVPDVASPLSVASRPPLMGRS